MPSSLASAHLFDRALSFVFWLSLPVDPLALISAFRMLIVLELPAAVQVNAVLRAPNRSYYQLLCCLSLALARLKWLIHSAARRILKMNNDPLTSALWMQTVLVGPNAVLMAALLPALSQKKEALTL